MAEPRNRPHQEAPGDVAPPTSQGITALRAQLGANLKLIGAAASVMGVPPEYVASVALTAFRKSEQLQRCSPISIVAALIHSVQLGLIPDADLGLAYLVPFAGECKLMVGYQGLATLALRSGRVLGINAELVWANEYNHPEFVLDMGAARRLVHRPLPPTQRGEVVVGVYATLEMPHPTGGSVTIWEWRWTEEIEAIRTAARLRNKGRESPAWTEYWGQMAKKTVTKALLKKADTSPATRKAVDLDDRLDLGLSQELKILSGMDEAGSTAESKTGEKAQALKDKLKSQRQDKNKPPEEGATEDAVEVRCPICGDTYSAVGANPANPEPCMFCEEKGGQQ